MLNVTNTTVIEYTCGKGILYGTGQCCLTQAGEALIICSEGYRCVKAADAKAIENLENCNPKPVGSTSEDTALYAIIASCVSVLIILPGSWLFARELHRRQVQSNLKTQLEMGSAILSDFGSTGKPSTGTNPSPGFADARTTLMLTMFGNNKE